MKNSETPSSAPYYLGHVHDGVVVFDVMVALQDGQAVRVEPVAEGSATPVDAAQEERICHMRDCFAQWTQEDSQLSDADADLLHSALEQNRGLEFGSPAFE